MTARTASLYSRFVTLAAGLLVLAAGGCANDPTEGYAAVTPYSQAFQTVAIPIIENETFARGIEFELTDALIKEIHARTPYRVTDQSRADTILLGRIHDVDLEQLSKSRLTGLGEEVIVAVTIDFQWRDLRTDQPLVAREDFTGTGLFVPSRPTGERIELGRMAVVQQLARDIVSELQASW